MGPQEVTMTHQTLAKRLSTCLWLTALAAFPAAAGIVYEADTTDHTGPVAATQTNRISIEGPNLRIQTLTEEGDSVDEIVWRGDKRHMIIINHGDKSYMVIDKETIKAMLASMPGAGSGRADDPSTDMMQTQMQEAMKKMEKEMASLDPKQREMIEKTLKGTMQPATAPPPAEFRSTGERATKEGYPCVRYDVLRGDSKVRELWVTEWAKIQGGKEATAVLEAMAGFQAEIMETMKNAAGPGAAGFFRMDETGLEDFIKTEGFPVVTRSFEGEMLESETTLTSVAARNIGPEAFEPPQGYSPRTMGAP
jgi:hypothetical protein